MNSQTLSDGHLHLWTLADLESAEGTADPSAVRSIRVGAQCYSSLQLGALLDRLGHFGPLEKIELADDRVPDEQMSDVQRKFEHRFPSASFKWSYDLLAGGKHGR